MEHVDICRKDTATPTQQHSRDPKAIREEECHRNRMRANDRVPSGEEPQKLRGFTKSLKEQDSPSDEKDQYGVWKPKTHLHRRRTADRGSVYTTEISIQPW
jgi:hypothetical protein